MSATDTIPGIPEKYARMVNGEPVISPAAFALLVGVTEAEFTAEVERQGHPDHFRMPQAWRRRGREIAARYGHGGMEAALRHLIAEHEAGLR